MSKADFAAKIALKTGTKEIAIMAAVDEFMPVVETGMLFFSLIPNLIQDTCNILTSLGNESMK